MPRFFLPDLSPGEIALPDEEAHHFAKVLRGRAGESVHVFDGRGRRAAAEVIAVAKRCVRVRVGEVTETPNRATVTLFVAAPKGDRFRWLVEKATELGVRAIQPIVTERTVTEPGGGKLDKLRQTSLAACKQCGRDWLMPIAEPIPLAEAVAGRITFAWADRGGRSPLGECEHDLFIGPEGGWSDDERVALRSGGGGLPIALGRHILRTETAAIAAAAICGGPESERLGDGDA